MDMRTTLIEPCYAFNARDLDRIMALFAEGCVLEMPRGRAPYGAVRGQASGRDSLATRFAGLPDVIYGGEEPFVDPAAETGISKWTLTGTNRDGAEGSARLRLLLVSRGKGGP